MVPSKVKYVLPEVHTSNSSRRFSQLCDRLEYDAHLTVLSAYDTIAKIFEVRDVFTDRPDIEKRVSLRDVLSVIVTDVSSIEDHIPLFLSRLPAFGQPGDETKINDAHAYCAHTKKVIAYFRELPRYDDLFTSRITN